MTVQNFVKIVWTVFEKFEIFMKRSGEKKQHDCISSRKFFPTPKKLKVGPFGIFQYPFCHKISETLKAPFGRKNFPKNCLAIRIN